MKVIYEDGKRNKALHGTIAGITPGPSGLSVMKIELNNGDSRIVNIRPADEDLKRSLAKFGKTPSYEMWIGDDPAVTGHRENFLYDSHYGE